MLRQRRRNGGRDGGARPRNVETTAARVSFRPRNILSEWVRRLLAAVVFESELLFRR